MSLNYKDNIIYVLICSVVLFLFVTKYIIIGLSILFLLLIIQIGEKKRIGIPRLVIFFIGFILLNVFQIVALGSQNAIEEIQRNFIYIIICFLLTTIDINFDSYTKVWRVMLMFCLGIQVMQLFKIGNINNVLRAFYGDSMFFRLSRYSLTTGFRSGSIFIAINPYFKFTAMCFSLFMFAGYVKILKGFRKWIYPILSVLSSLLTGSRTAYIIVFALLAYFIIYYVQKKKSIEALVKLAFSFAVLLFFAVYFIIRFNLFEARFFGVSETGSFDYKIRIIQQFIRESNLNVILFGQGAYDVDSGYLAMDSDIGYMLSYYGLVGFAYYIVMLVYIIRYLRTYDYKDSILFSNMIGITLFLSIITSGVYFNYRVFSMILICIISFKKSTLFEIDFKEI